MVVISSNYKVPKSEHTTSEDKSKQMHPQIKIINEHLKNITKFDKLKKEALLRRDAKQKTTTLSWTI